jgi:hypothetical protein
LLEAGETAIDHIARELYLERRAMRREITRAISHGNFENRLERFGDKNVKCVYDEMGKVGFIKVSEKTSLGDPAFWISAIKNVWMLLIFMPEDGEKHARRSAVKSESARKKWIVRGRITIEGDGITFDDLHMNDFDPFWTCKWNSGSNWSRGGTELDPMYYTELVSTRVDNLKRRRFSFEMSMQRSLEKETCQTVRYSKPSA